MNAIELAGLERVHARRVTRLPTWVLPAGLALAVVSFVASAVRNGPTGALIYHGVVAVGITVSMVMIRRGRGEQVTHLEPERVGTGTRSWRGHLELSWTPWSDVEQVTVPGPWADDASLVLHDGSKRLLPGVSRDDARTLARALTTAQDGSEEVQAR